MTPKEFYEYCVANLAPANYIDAGVRFDSHGKTTFSLTYEPSNSKIDHYHTTSASTPEGVIKSIYDRMEIYDSHLLPLFKNQEK